MIYKSILIITIIILLILLNELIHGIIRQKQRQNIYHQALSRSNQINKPLLVFGDPYYGFGSRFYNLFMEGYNCGDITVDLTGAPNCPSGIKSDMLNYLKTQPSNSKVIFISCVLEYIDNIEEVIKEIYRVADSSNNIFIVTVNQYTLSAYLYKEDQYQAKNLIKGPPTYNEITFKKISSNKE